MLIIHNCEQRQEEHSKRDKDEALSSLRLRMCNSEWTHARTHRWQDITGAKASKHSSVFYSCFSFFFLGGGCIVDDVAEGTCPLGSDSSLVASHTPRLFFTPACGETNLGFQLLDLMLDVVDVLRVLQALVRHAPGPLDQVQRQDGHAVCLEDRRIHAKMNTKIMKQINKTKKKVVVCE